VALFALTGGYFGARLFVDRGRYDLVRDVSHVLMAAVMIMMPFGWSARIPASAQLAVFTGFALWYIYLGVFCPSVLGVELRGSHHAGRLRLLYHAAMMLAMAWMAVIMAPLPSVGPAASGAGATAMIMHDHGGGPAPTAVVAGAGSGGIGSGWSDPVSFLIGIGFGVAAVWYAVRFVLLAGRPSGRVIGVGLLIATAADALMAAGMALSELVVMR